MSSKLAVSIAISLEERRKNPDAAPAPNGTISYGPSGSDVGSAHRALGIIRSLLSPASHGSVQHSHARRRVETILRDVLKNVRAEDLTDYDMKRINDFANCTNIVRHVDCDDYNNLRYRTIDGTCNNFFYPLNGAAETPLARLLPAVYEDGVSIPVGHKQATEGDPFSPPWPSPRHISWKMVKNLEVPNTGTTHMLMQWGQFLDHDLDISPIIPEEECMDCEFTDACLPILVHPRDTVYGVKKFECLPFSRSIPACVCGAAKRSLPRNQINQLTAYIDASNVYGSSNELSDSLRLMSGGLLKQGGRQDSLKGNLPFQTEKPAIGDVPFFVAGDERSNEQLALTIMHTVWMRQHNRIARALSDINPCWNDERIFQETRKIVGAQMQVITFKEFLPIVFGVNYETYIPPHRGYNPFVDASIPNSFSAAAYRFGHSLVRPLLERLDKDFKPEAIGHLPLSQAFFNPIEYFRSGGTDPILRGLISDTSNVADIFVNSVLTSKLFAEAEDKLGMDLASLNIQRGRDHGLPSYRQWEQLCGKLFPDVKPKFASRDIARGLRNMYGSEGFKYGIDLWVGGLAEKRIQGGQIGPTFACILSLAFNRVRDGDRFWYENPYVFKASQRYEVMQHTSLAKVVCENADHIPRLQRSVFRLGGEKVDCSKIDDINLWKWWDRSCYYQRYYTKYYG